MCIRDSKNPYQEVQDRIKTFWKRTEFTNEHSIGHVRENLIAIEDRLDDLDDNFLDFLLSKCQFVVVRLPEISEAFQFFDSQNARGKDLEPHDLLKAFHLREIKRLSEKDSDNITKWQDLDPQRLVELFLTLYRVKRWAKNNLSLIHILSTQSMKPPYKCCTIPYKRSSYAWLIQPQKHSRMYCSSRLSLIHI